MSDIFHESRPRVGDPRHATFRLAFSPAGMRLAIASGWHDTAEGPVAHVAVIGLSDLKVVFATEVSASFITGLSWAPSGSRLLSQSQHGSVLFDSDGKQSCKTGDPSLLGAGFISEDRFVALAPESDTTAIKVFDTTCRLVSEHVAPIRIASVDGDPKTGLLAATGEWGDVYLFRGASVDITGHLQLKHTQLYIRIYSGGGGVCVGPIASPGDATLHCWEVRDSEARMASTWPAKNGGTQPVASASGSPLIAFINSQFSYNAFTERKLRKLLEWVFWNAQTGRIEATMPIALQVVKVMEHIPPAMEPDIVALSPDGRRFAKAGNTDVEIFDLPSENQRPDPQKQ